MKSTGEHTPKNFMIEGAIFDCDGTLLDSLDSWRGLEVVLSQEARVQVTPEERALFTTFTIPEVARYFHEQYGLLRSVDAVIGFIDDYMMDYYAHRAHVIPGVLPFLEACASADVSMCVASSSAQKYLQAGLKNAGIAEYFSHVFSVEDLGSSKREPLIFNHAQQVLGTDRATTWGIDDSFYALETLKKAAFPTIALYDQLSDEVRSQAEELCEFAVSRLDELVICDNALALRFNEQA